MSDLDPKSQRHIQTRDGVASVARNQVGVPLKEYFRNTEIPENLDRALVFQTGKGPVLASPDPEPWSAKHEDRAREYAKKIKTQIDEKGFYSKTLAVFAGRLADATGQPKDEMKAVIAKSFEVMNDKDPYTYLNDLRVAQGKPTRSQSQRIDQEPQ